MLMFLQDMCIRRGCRILQKEAWNFKGCIKKNENKVKDKRQVKEDEEGKPKRK